MKKNKIKTFISLVLFVFMISLLFFHLQVNASQVIKYQPLAPIPTPDNSATIGKDATIGTYFSQMYKIGVGVATALAVLMVIWGGVQYVTTDAIGGKEEGKERIQNAILGLLLALGSYLILYTINPALLNTDLNVNPIKVDGTNNGNPFQVGGGASQPSAPTTPQQDALQGSSTMSPTDAQAYAQNVVDTYWSDDLQKTLNNGPTDPGYQSALDTWNSIQNTISNPNNYVTYPSSGGSSATFSQNSDGTFSITANNPAVDTDGSGNPGFDNNRTADGRPQHQNVTALGGLNSLTDAYIAVPSSYSYLLGKKVNVYDATTGLQTQAVVGDTGATGWGEGSVATWRNLGRTINSNSVPNDKLTITLPSGTTMR